MMSASDGQCVGDDSNCECTISFESDGVKVTSMQLGEGGFSDQALDVDDNPDTCVPDGDCEDGLDNAMGLFASLGNEYITEFIEAGDIMNAIEFEPLGDDTFLMTTHQVKLSSTTPDCDFQTQTCEYILDFLGFGDDGAPLAQITGTLTDGTFSGGDWECVALQITPQERRVSAFNHL